MSGHNSFMGHGLTLALAFMLFACGGGSSTDDSATVGANDAVTVANRSVPENVFTATLDANQQALQSNSTATGIGIVMVDPDGGLMRATLTTAGMLGISAAMRLAPSATTGATVFPLTETSAGSGIWSAQTTLTGEQLTALRNGNYYFDVRSAAFPDGEIRGRIVPQLPASGVSIAVDAAGNFGNGNLTNGSGGFTGAGDMIGAAGPNTSTTGTAIDPGGLDTSGTTGLIGRAGTPGTSARRTTFVNVLTGTQQIPPNGSSTLAIGVAILDFASRSLVSSITSLGIAGLGAHIHRAAAGSSGQTLISLNETSAASGIWAARIALSETQLDAFRSGTHYFDIHTSAFPNGEIRGQIIASGGTGGFRIGTVGTANNGREPGVNTGTDTNPFVSDTGTGNAVMDGSGAGIPTFGNPLGSGIGSGIDTGVTSGIPSLGNPAGSGIGSATDAEFSDTPVSGAALTGIAAGSGPWPEAPPLS